MMALMFRASLRIIKNVNTRQIYSDRYLGLTTILTRQHGQLEQLKLKQDLSNLEDTVIDSANRGLLLSSDVELVSQLIVVAGPGVGALEDIDQSMSDLTFYKDIILKYISLNKHSKISMVNAAPHITKFYQLCHLMTAPDLALQMFDNQHVKDNIPVNSELASYSHLVLINLLFKSQKYEEVIRVYEEMDISQFIRHYESNSIIPLVLLALVKLKPSDVFSKATLLVDEYMTEENRIFMFRQGKGLLTHVYSWLACMDEKYPTAYEIIQAQTKRIEWSRKKNLELYTLIKMNKIVEAIFALEDLIDNFDAPGRPRNKKPKVCKEVIQLLVHKVVNESEDEEIKSRMKSVFSKLDFVAEITEDSIEDLLFEPIDVTISPMTISPSQGLVDLRKNYGPKHNLNSKQNL